MGGGRTHEFLVTLRRDSPNEPWGFSLVGGADVNTPLIVTRVSFGSRADGVLQRGDIITKIGSYDARDVRHQDAQTLFNTGDNNIRVVVQREPGKARKGGSTGSSLTSPLSVSPNLSPRGGNISSPAYSPGAPALTPYYSTPFTPLDDYHFNVQEDLPGRRGDASGSGVHVSQQPYRTTPLLLPGAKITRDAGHDTSLGDPNPDELKTGPYRTTPLVCPEPKATRDVGHTESYLRHHPNPAVRAPPGHAVDPDHFFKSKVANTVLQRIQMDDPNKQVVHKQFNSPIHMYSDANIADTLQKQGVRVRKPVKYNPAESETYRAVQEEQLGNHVQEFSAPAQPKVFTSHKPAQVKVADPVYHLPRKTVHNVGENPEIIHQSGSFKRLMWNVMAESNY